MIKNKTAPNYSSEILKELEEVRRKTAEFVSSRLARGNLNLQNSNWPSEEKWKKRKKDHAEKLKFLLDVIRVKQQENKY
jgi:hypothetical protein